MCAKKKKLKLIYPNKESVVEFFKELRYIKAEYPEEVRDYNGEIVHLDLKEPIYIGVDKRQDDINVRFFMIRTNGEIHKALLFDKFFVDFPANTVIDGNGYINAAKSICIFLPNLYSHCISNVLELVTNEPVVVVKNKTLHPVTIDKNQSFDQWTNEDLDAA